MQSNGFGNHTLVTVLQELGRLPLKWLWPTDKTASCSMAEQTFMLGDHVNQASLFVAISLCTLTPQCSAAINQSLDLALPV